MERWCPKINKFLLEIYITLDGLSHVQGLPRMETLLLASHIITTRWTPLRAPSVYSHGNVNIDFMAGFKGVAPKHWEFQGPSILYHCICKMIHSLHFGNNSDMLEIDVVSIEYEC